jgi:hypothetical protein
MNTYHTILVLAVLMANTSTVAANASDNLQTRPEPVRYWSGAPG